MQRNLTRTTFTIGILVSAYLFQVVSLAEPHPVAPVTRPTDDDLKGISFEISAERSAPKVGDPVLVKALLKNISKRPLIFPDRRGEGDEINYLISIERASGKSPILTDRGVTLYSPRDWEKIRDIHRAVKPGDSIEVSLDIARIYQITEPGEYRVQVKRYVYKGRQDLLIPILSNVLVMKIDPH